MPKALVKIVTSKHRMRRLAKRIPSLRGRRPRRTYEQSEVPFNSGSEADPESNIMDVGREKKSARKELTRRLNLI